MPLWAEWITFCLAVIGAAGVIFNVIHHRWQRRIEQRKLQRQAAAEEERVEIRKPLWMLGWGGLLRVETVNIGKCPVFIRVVRVHGPRAQQPIVLQTAQPGEKDCPLAPGGRRWYERKRQEVESLLGGPLDGTWITAESTRGKVWRVDVDPTVLDRRL